jgi:CDGSH-type Zn-finger protein
MTEIKVRADGPLLVEGDDVALVDWNGRPYSVDRRPVALCRCGGSANRPFCDGSHRGLNFKASEAAPA